MFNRNKTDDVKSFILNTFTVCRLQIKQSSTHIKELPKKIITDNRTSSVPVFLRVYKSTIIRIILCKFSHSSAPNRLISKLNIVVNNLLKIYYKMWYLNNYNNYVLSAQFINLFFHKSINWINQDEGKILYAIRFIRSIIDL